jgi:anti-anti-sigma regulatory factor
MIIKVGSDVGAFGGDKDAAARIRDLELKPAIAKSDDDVVLDFAGVDFVTQSFIHALISQVVRRDPAVLNRIRFDNCTRSVAEIIEIVVEYSQHELGGPSVRRVPGEE